MLYLKRISSGEMGAALAEVYSETRQQRCWMYKTMNVLNCLPKTAQGKAKQSLNTTFDNNSFT